MERTSNLSNGLLWFGAAVSIAEIFTGTLVAPLGLQNAIAAVIIGHLIGFVIFYLAGLIGANSGLAAMESSRISFGKYGSYLFSVLNILQLVGWTAVMIIGGAKALDQIVKSLTGFEGQPLWCVIIGLLIIIWIMAGIKNLGKLNNIAVGLLFLLTIALSFVIFRGNPITNVTGEMTFGGAVELSVALPLSWLPLVADYTRFAKKPKQATLISSLAYFVGSSFMYLIGLGAAIYAGLSDIGSVLLASGLGIAGLLIVIFATVTTTFLDAYSAGVSFSNISKKINEKYVAIIVCVIGILFAIFTPIEEYQDFLYLIGSVFAPMAAILLTDYFIFKKRDISGSINILNIILWAVGFSFYRWFLAIDTPIGSTVPVMIVISILCMILNWGKKV